MDRQQYIEEKLNTLFSLWLSYVVACSIILFLILSILDYFVTPDNFRTFFVYRMSISILLLIIFSVIKIMPNRSAVFYKILAYIAILASAITVELMIVRYGGHSSPYYTGMILLGILVIGFIPADFLFNLFSSVLIYAAFLLPILSLEKITDVKAFGTANAFILSAFISILFLRYLNTKRLRNEFGLSYDLNKHKEHFKLLVEESSVQLSGAVSQLTDEAAERAKVEEKIKSQLARQQAHSTIDMTIIQSRDLHSILSTLLAEVTARLKVDAADVLLLNAEQLKLEYAAHRGFKTDRIKQIKLQFGQGCAGNIALDRKKIVIPDITTAEDKFVSIFNYKLSQAYLFKEEGFKSYFGIPLIVKGMVRGVLEVFHRTMLDPDDEWLDFLDALANKAAIAMDYVSLFDSLDSSKQEVLKAYDLTIEALALALDYRDHKTKGHSTRVTELTLRIAKIMGVSGEDLIHFRRGALLHDIGKLAVPDSILFKPGPLTENERMITQMHPVIAYEMLSPIKFLAPALDIPYCHHERWDGTGYPRGLKSEAIPLSARIFAIVDVWDALKSDRPYRAAWPDEKIFAEIRSNAGKHFDPKVVDIFLFLQEGAAEHGNISLTEGGSYIEKLNEPVDTGGSFYMDEFMKYFDED
jgi:HD-GYP domain-containing protein (c-di-GMP phosphodiesterase class II)